MLVRAYKEDYPDYFDTYKMTTTRSRNKYTDQIDLLKQALLDVQKRYAYWFEISPKKKNLTHKTIMGHCFFGVKNGKPLLFFYHDSDLPGTIRDECYRAFDAIFDSQE